MMTNRARPDRELGSPNGNSSFMVHRSSLVLLCVALLSVAIAVPAQQYPTRPVRLLVPFAPGGGADALARIITPRLHELLGQPWVVDNRGGAAGNLAAETVAHAVPDGYTVFLGFGTVLTVNPSLYKLTFSMERDLQPVTLLASAQYILVLHPSVPAGSLKEFIALAKQKPGTLNYASAGVGSPLHLAAELFKKRAGIDMVHLAYKGGGPAAAAVLGGEAQVLFGSVASSMPQVKAGRLKALATTGLKRSKVAPDLPTIAESGFPGFDVTSWYALLVPARTPVPIIDQIRNAALKALALPEVREAMSRQGLEVETSTPQELAARIRTETKTWAEVIRTAGIKAE
ncbi:MAG TPA: tripartite tricarboxylate transporter substrate binding protein [Burkholderiales bacterium]|nr:tripartite tricarboxylate transporter substrate binding protein [Burkholderiales bacterium]